MYSNFEEMSDQIGKEIAKITSCSTSWDDWSKKIYSVDASSYQIEPMVISAPANEFEVQAISKYAFQHRVPLTCRGAGTGLLGQCLSNGIVLDLVQNMNKIIELGERYVIVQPGITKHKLDKELEKRGKFIPPNPASSNYCTLGGMIANNSSGPYTLGYGSIMNYLIGVKTVYSGGEFGYAYDNGPYDSTVKKVINIVSNNLDLIQRTYPKVTKNSCGYRLDSIIENDLIHPQRIFLASEGTLGIVTSAKLLILDVPEFRHLCLLSFPTVQAASASIPFILKYKPVATELLDRSTMGKISNVHDTLYDSCTLLVEFHGNGTTLMEQKIKEFEYGVSQFSRVIESTNDKTSIEKIWNERKNALNNVLKQTIGSRKPLGMIEDTVLDPSLLLDFVNFLIDVYRKYNVSYAIYGHAGDGNLHTRPIIDTEQKTGIDTMEMITSDVFRFILGHGGSISGEHGDGLARVKHVFQMYGSEIYSLFVKTKQIFDKNNIMNPGKKVLFET